MTIAINTGAAVAAAFMVYVYAVCRMSVLQFGRHKASWVLMHIGLGGASCWVLVHALQGAADLQDACVLLAAGAWAWLSQESFSAGPPPAAKSRPMPLEAGDTVPMEPSP